MSKYDVIVIGSGPGGYVAAIRCAQLGFKTAIIEKYDTLGGTCLNVGCIPSKALLDSSEHYYTATHSFEKHGIMVKEVKPDFKKMVERKRSVVDQTCKGVEFLMGKNKIDILHGVGSFVDKNTLKITDNKGSNNEIKTDKVIIATGSKPNYFPGMEPDKKRIITSTEALELPSIPKKMVIIGGGVIGLEIGSVYARLGTAVEVVEFADSIIPNMDVTMGKELTKVLKKLGVKFYLQHKVQEVKNLGKKVKVTALDKNDKSVTFDADYCLVAVGRKPYTDGLALENVGISTNKRGQIEVNENLQTSVASIYAIGDVIKGAMLAHKAEEEGTFVAEKMAGQLPEINYNLIPGVVYTWPEVASVGKTEQQVKEEGIEYKIGSFPMKALGRARASMDIQGLVKIIADKATDEILGMHIIGARAADMIMEGTIAMEFRASAEDLVRTSHPHPTYTEAIREAAMDATAKRSIHV